MFSIMALSTIAMNGEIVNPAPNPMDIDSPILLRVERGEGENLKALVSMSSYNILTACYNS